MLERKKMTAKEIEHFRDAIYDLDASQESDLTEYHRGEITVLWEIQHAIDYLTSYGYGAEEILDTIQKDIGFHVLWIAEREWVDL